MSIDNNEALVLNQIFSQKRGDYVIRVPLHPIHIVANVVEYSDGSRRCSGVEQFFIGQKARNLSGHEINNFKI